MDQLSGNVRRNLTTIGGIAAKNPDADIRITRGAGGGNVVVKPVEIKKGWVAWFCGLFGFDVSKKDTSGSSEHFISAFTGNYGEAAGGAIIKECGIRAGKALSGRNVARAMQKAGDLTATKRNAEG